MSIVHDFKDIARRMKDPSNREEKGLPECFACNDTGYITYGIGHMDPHFRKCERCGNPKGHPCP